MLLMRVMIMEYNQLLFPGRFRLQWGMREVLQPVEAAVDPTRRAAPRLPRRTIRSPEAAPSLRSRHFSPLLPVDAPQVLTALRSLQLTPPPSKKDVREDFNSFHHSFYLATHIVYVQSAYNAIKADQREIPWLYRYVRASFRFWLKECKAKLADPSVYVDLDGIAEIVDCLRGAGLTEASDPMVCEGTLLLLRFQRKNGSWPAWLPGETNPDEKALDTYHRVHPTWVCTQCLRDRDFRIADNQFWPAFISKCLKETQFHKLLYKPTW